MNNINVLILGCNGYIGLELVKLLLNHSKVKIKYLCGYTSVGKKLSTFDKYFKKYKLPKISKFNKKYLNKIDIVFSALPNGDAQKISKFLTYNQKLIDLSGDFRLLNHNDYKKWYKIKHKAPKKIKDSIYALPEIKGSKIKNYKIISCPGCYPTTVLLPLTPLLKKNLISSKNIIIDAKSGYSGGGRGVFKKYKNINLLKSMSVYGISNHKHNAEIQQELNLVSKSKVDFTFTPSISPMFRGIITNIYFDLNKKVNLSVVFNELKRYYKINKFIKIKNKNTLLSTNSVINTNFCEISVCKSKEKNKAIIVCVIDNLIKGGAGQAVQNLNILYNFKFNEGFK